MRRQAIFIVLVTLLVFALSSPSIARQDSQQQANIDTFLRLFTEGYNQGNGDLLYEIYAPDIKLHVPSGSYTPNGEAEDMAAMHAAMPDLTYEVPVIIAQGDYVGAIVIAHGTFQNDLVAPNGASYEATGEPYEFLGHRYARFNEAGQIAESWVVFDFASYINQINGFGGTQGATSSAQTESAMPMLPTMSESMTTGMADAHTEAARQFITAGFGEGGSPDAITELVSADYAHHLMLTPPVPNLLSQC